MKQILVPTDFSACASNAVKAALDLAAFTGASIHLFSRLKLRSDWMELNESQQESFPEDLQIIHNAEQLFEEWVEQAEARNIKIHASWGVGKLHKLLQEYVETYGIDFIVMGSHGASGKNEYLIGSNTQKTVRRVHCPVLVIKEDLSDYEINKVIFASNFNSSEKVAFQYLLDFLDAIPAEIHLVQVNTSSWFSQPHVLVKAAMKDFKAMCGDRPCFTHFYSDWSVDYGIRHLSQEIGADLIAISNVHRHPLKRLTAGSNVEALINHSKIPVLSIDFPKAN